MQQEHNFAGCHFAVREDRAPQELLDYLNQPQVFDYHYGNHGIGLHGILKLSYYDGLDPFHNPYPAGGTMAEGNQVDAEILLFIRHKLTYDNVPPEWSKYTRAILEYLRNNNFQLLAAQVPLFFDTPNWDKDTTNKGKSHTCLDLYAMDGNGQLVLIEIKVGRMDECHCPELKFFQHLEHLNIKANLKNKHHLQLYFTGKALEKTGLRVDRKIIINANWIAGNREVVEVDVYDLEPWAVDIPEVDITEKLIKSEDMKKDGDIDAIISRRPSTFRTEDRYPFRVYTEKKRKVVDE